MAPSWIDACNERLDRLPVRQIRLGDRSLSVFMLWSILGLFAGCSLFVVILAWAGLDLALGLALIPIALTSSLIVSLARERRTGVERWVLLHHLFATVAPTAIVVAWAGRQPLPWLDAFVTASALMYAVGRFGCTMNGCCHGSRAGLGIDYGPDHAIAGRCFPVPLLDSALWWIALTLGLVCIASAPAGSATAVIAIWYGVGRLVLEELRGDDRPRLWGRSESTWLALLLIAGACALLVASRRPPTSTLIAGAVGIALALGWWLSAPRWLKRRPAFDPELATGLVALGRDIGDRGPERGVRRSSVESVSATSSWVELAERTELYVSLSRMGAGVVGLDAIEAEVALEHVARGLGISRPKLAVLESTPGVFVTRFDYRELTGPDGGRDRPASRAGADVSDGSAEDPGPTSLNAYFAPLGDEGDGS